MYKCDLTDREDVYAVADRVKAEVGTVDVLINNAGIVSGSYFLDTPDSEFSCVLYWVFLIGPQSDVIHCKAVSNRVNDSMHPIVSFGMH